MNRDPKVTKPLVLVQLVGALFKAASWLLQATIKIVSLITPRWVKQLLAWGLVFGLGWLFMMLRAWLR